MTSEFEDTKVLANRVLERPNADPDDDLAMLARQFLRAVERPTTFFVIIAYRWGWSNAEWYVVDISADEDAALSAAKEECDDRAGKYGIEVLKWPEQTRVGYFASTYGEECPQYNARISAAERIGLEALGAYQDGEVWLSEDGSALERRKVDVPQWLAARCEQELKISSAFAEGVNKARGQRMT